MHDFGISICSALVSSLFVALTLIPLVASRFLHYHESSNSMEKHSRTIRKPESSLIKKLTARYTKFVELTLRFRWVTVVVAILIVVLAFYLYGKLETEVVRRGIYRESRLQVDVPRSYSIDDTKKLFERLERILQENKEELEIETVSCNFDRSEGTLSVYFVKQEVAKRPVSVLEKEMRFLFPVIPGVKYTKRFRHGRGGSGREISIEIKGRNINTLTRLSGDIKDRLASVTDLSDVQTNLEKGKDEIVVSIDREKVKRYGLTSERIAFGIAGSLGNRAVSKFKIEDSEIDIVLQLKEEDRQRLDQLKNFESENSEEESVVLGRVVDFEQRRGPEAIERKDRKPIVIITAQYNSRGLKKIRDGIMEKMAGFNLPAGYEWNLGEEFRRFEREESETKFGLILAIILIYLIMASLFESYIHPLAILLAIPFAFTGVAVAFSVLDVPLDSVSRLGLLLLCGLVVNNAIVLIDYVNRLRRDGMERHDAIVKGGKDRMRPILMTTFTTILGLLPMVLPLFLPFLFGPFEGRGSIWAPVGLVVISGLITSTILTLVIMPTIYSLIDDFGMWIKKVFAFA